MAKKLNKPATDIKPVVEAFIDEILSVMSEQDNKIEIRGFGTFMVKHRKPKVGRNPRTGEVVHIPESESPVFKFSREANEIIDKSRKGVLQGVLQGYQEVPITNDI